MPFFNELDVLEIHLEELYDHVDHFVIVESCETYMGQPKPYYFEENKERYSRFIDKIIHIKVDTPYDSQSPWPREYFQRGQLMRGIENADPNDTIILCDCDEILSSEALERVKDSLDERSLFIFHLEWHNYFLNLYRHFDWPGPIMFKRSLLKHIEITNIHFLRLSDEYINLLKQLAARNIHCKVYKHSGWHFHSMGGLDMVIRKFNSWSHADDKKFIEWKKNPARNYLNTIEESIQVPINSYFPKAVLRNIETLKEKGLIFDEAIHRELLEKLTPNAP